MSHFNIIQTTLFTVIVLAAYLKTYKPTKNDESSFCLIWLYLHESFMGCWKVTIQQLPERAVQFIYNLDL